MSRASSVADAGRDRAASACSRRPRYTRRRGPPERVGGRDRWPRRGWRAAHQRWRHHRDGDWSTLASLGGPDFLRRRRRPCRRQNHHRGERLSVHQDSNVVAIRIGGKHVKQLACSLVGRRECDELLSVAEGDL